MSSNSKLKNLGNLKLNKSAPLFKAAKNISQEKISALDLVQLLDGLLVSLSECKFDVLCRIVQLPGSVILGLLSIGKNLKPEVSCWKDIQALLLKFCPIDNAWSLKDAEFVSDISNGVYDLGRGTHSSGYVSVIHRRHRVFQLESHFHRKIDSWRLNDIDIWFVQSELLKLIIYCLQYKYWIGGYLWGHNWGLQFETDIDERISISLPRTQFHQVHDDISTEVYCSSITDNICTQNDLNFDSLSRAKLLLICCAFGRSRFTKWESFEHYGHSGLFSLLPSRAIFLENEEQVAC